MKGSLAITLAVVRRRLREGRRTRGNLVLAFLADEKERLVERVRATASAAPSARSPSARRTGSGLRIGSGIRDDLHKAFVPLAAGLSHRRALSAGPAALKRLGARVAAGRVPRSLCLRVGGGGRCSGCRCVLG
ncbi:hypothetical protein GCM10009735_69190 [Actinomadura chokoriensis]